MKDANSYIFNLGSLSQFASVAWPGADKWGKLVMNTLRLWQSKLIVCKIKNFISRKGSRDYSKVWHPPYNGFQLVGRYGTGTERNVKEPTI